VKCRQKSGKWGSKNRNQKKLCVCFSGEGRGHDCRAKIETPGKKVASPAVGISTLILLSLFIEVNAIWHLVTLKGNDDNAQISAAWGGRGFWKDLSFISNGQLRCTCITPVAEPYFYLVQG
jgi:hypothetical protein